jgi:hypothetical protein
LLSFVTPPWLFGLVLLPVIRWLHRGGPRRRAVAVSRLGLWRASKVQPPAAGERRPPDPAWRRRALLAALLFVALAEPRWPAPQEAVTLWVDDSMSMLTREAQGTRLAMGMAQARAQLAASAHADVQVRALGEPWRHFDAPTAALAAELAASAGHKPAQAPPAALLRRDRRHWLLTDGAHAEVLAWPAGMPPDRLLQLGGVTRNVGLERLSARRRLADADQVDLLLKVSNGGTVAETRTLVFTGASGELERRTLRLEPAGSVQVNAVVPLAAEVRAALQPADALPEDDEIRLDLAPLHKRRVATDAECPAALVAAVRAHPALAPAPFDATDVQAVLDCGSPGSLGAPGAARGLPTLRVWAEHLPAPARGALQWSPAVEGPHRIRLDAQTPRLAARLQVGAADAVLLAAGEEPVIVSRAGAPRRLETAIDFAALGRAGGAELPLLVNLMFEQLLGGRLLDTLAISDRGPASSRVVPVPRAAGSAGAGADAGAIASAGTTASAGVIASAGAAEMAAREGQRGSALLRDGVRPLVVAALLVLLWEMVALGHQWLRLRRDVEAQSG